MSMTSPSFQTSNVPSGLRASTELRLRLREEAHRRRCRSDLTAWCVEALSTVGHKPARHHRLLISKLEAVARGEIDRLMVFMPPRHAKSEYISKLFVPWFIANHPNAHVIAASHTYDLAVRFGRQARNLILQHGDTLGYTLRSDTMAADRWSTTNGCGYVAAGVGKAIAGLPATLFIIDDPLPGRAEAESETTRRNIWDWYTSDVITRLHPGAAVILVMTRWHEEDLAGHLLDQMQNGGDRWDILRLPAFAETDDPMGRAPGEPLWPEWLSAEALNRIRSAESEYEWSALYQQNPHAPGTSFFSVDKLLVDGAGVDYPTKCDFVFAVMDCAVKGGTEHDGTAVSYWARSRFTGHPLICLDWDIVQINSDLLEQWIPSVFARAEELARVCGARMGSKGVLIEDAAAGSTLLQQCARRRLPATALPSKLTAMGKDVRAINAGYGAHRGDVKFSQFAYDKTMLFKGATRNHMLTQVAGFRLDDKKAATRADDLIDTFCYAIAITIGDQEGIS